MYLRTDTLFLICALAISFAALNRIVTKHSIQTSLYLLVFDVALLWYVSEKLTLVYFAYLIISYAYTCLIRILKRGRKQIFVLLCLIDALPLLYMRFAEMDSRLPMPITLIGFAYNTLKAYDALFYVYYTDEKLPFITYANYLLFFPVITAGPIFRYRDFEKVFREPIPITSEICERSVKRFIRGLFKKLVLVSWVQMCLTAVLPQGQHFYVSATVSLCCYLILYFDLSGYSDIAIAVSELMGFPAPENFKKPWEAASFTQFWRKWHVTLSDWIREHIFVVLNGKKLTKAQAALTGFLTMLAMSLWYSFRPGIIAAGTYMGVCLAVENLFSLTTFNRRRSPKSVFVLRCIIVNYLFAINAMVYIFAGTQLKQLIGGFFHL